jgi:hypothetical protein
MLVGKERSLPYNLSRAPLYDRLLALLANRRPGWEGLPTKNNPAYYEDS